jgi:hypothetical protein
MRNGGRERGKRRRGRGRGRGRGRSMVEFQVGGKDENSSIINFNCH